MQLHDHYVHRTEISKTLRYFEEKKKNQFEVHWIKKEFRPFGEWSTKARRSISPPNRTQNEVKCQSSSIDNCRGHWLRLSSFKINLYSQLLSGRVWISSIDWFIVVFIIFKRSLWLNNCTDHLTIANEKTLDKRIHSCVHLRVLLLVRAQTTC